MSPATEEPGFARLQRQFAGHIRDPEAHAVPAGIEDRRMGIYRELFYRNIDDFIRGAFPILHAILPESHWQSMIRDFMVRHRCQTPYFLEISQEFIRYLQQVRQPQARDPEYMLELAHYEWVELALDVADVEPDWTGIDANGDLLEGRPVVSATAWSLAYHYPVHRIGPGWQPEAGSQEHTWLIVYRNREDTVKFMEINAVTARLLELIVANERMSGRQALQQLAIETKDDNLTRFYRLGMDILVRLQARGIVLGVRSQELTT